MNMKFNTVIGILALGAAGQATAAISLGSAPGGSSLILSVWDSIANESYTRNLGTNLNGFLPTGLTTLPGDGTVTGTPNTGDKTPAAGLVLSFAGDALFTATFGNNSPNNIQWNIVAFDQFASLQFGLTRVITTATGQPNTTNGGMSLITFGGNNYLDGLLRDAPTLANPGVNSVVVTDPSLPSFAGNPGWGDGLNGGNLSTSATGYSDSLSFYYVARTQISGLGSTLATTRLFSNGVSDARWTLASDGTATYALSPVPAPPALWMIGAGLMGVLGASRRRARASAA